MVEEGFQDMRRTSRVAFGILLSSLLAGCSMVGNKPANPERVITVGRGNIVETVNPTGEIIAHTTSDLNFPFGGVFKQYDVALGQVVKKGQVLAELESATQEAAVAQAEASLAQAKDKLAGIEAGALPGAVPQAQGNLDAAKAKLQAIKDGPRPANVTQAQAALDAAEQKLAQMKQGPRKATVDQAKANLAASEQAVTTAQVKLDSVKKNAPLLLKSAEAKVQSAKDTLYAAQTSRDGVCGNSRNPGYQCQSANANVNSAQDNIDAAQSALSQQKIQNDADLKSAQAALAQAQAQVTADQAALKLAGEPYTAQDIAQQVDAVTEAKAALELAKKPYTSSDIAQAQAAVMSAEGALQSANTPYTVSDRAQAEDAVKQSAAALVAVQKNLDDTKLRAPFDGSVLSEPAAPGNYVGTNANPVVVGTTGEGSAGLEVLANVDEVDVTKLKVGQPVQITADALPGKVFHGHIVIVPPQGTTVLNVVTYPTYIALDDGQNLLKPSMTVTCAIEVAKHNNVLVVPTTAVSDVNGKTYVMLAQPNGAPPIAREVTTGLSSITQTEILKGLQEGDKIVLGAAPSRAATRSAAGLAPRGPAAVAAGR